MSIYTVSFTGSLLGELDKMGFGKIKLVMDRGFYSEANIHALYKKHRKFLLASRMSLNYIKQSLEPLYDNFRTFEYCDSDYELYAHTVSTQWKYRYERPYKGDVIEEPRRLYIHYYFNIERAADEEKCFDKRLLALREELLEDRPRKDHESLYAKYFIVTRTPKRGVKVQVKADRLGNTSTLNSGEEMIITSTVPRSTWVMPIDGDAIYGGKENLFTWVAYPEAQGYLIEYNLPSPIFSEENTPQVEFEKQVIRLSPADYQLYDDLILFSISLQTDLEENIVEGRIFALDAQGNIIGESVSSDRTTVIWK